MADSLVNPTILVFNDFARIWFLGFVIVSQCIAGFRVVLTSLNHLFQEKKVTSFGVLNLGPFIM